MEALPVAISADLFRPSLTWLVSGGGARGGLLVRNLAASRDSARIQPVAGTLRRRRRGIEAHHHADASTAAR